MLREVTKRIVFSFLRDLNKRKIYINSERMWQLAINVERSEKFVEKESILEYFETK